MGCLPLRLAKHSPPPPQNTLTFLMVMVMNCVQEYYIVARILLKTYGGIK